jgi:cell division protein FtsB
MRFQKVVVAGVLLAAVFIFSYFYLPGYSRYQDLRKREEALVSEIADLKSTNAGLEKEEARLKSDVTELEKVVRNEMGLVKQGEVLYKIVEEDISKQVTPSGSVQVAKPVITQKVKKKTY